MSPEDTMDSPSPEEPKKRGPRKASEVIAETEERVRAEMQAELDEMRTKLAEAEQAKVTAEAAVPKTETLEDQLQLDPINEIDPEADGAITIHFVEDGLTILGKVWVRGEELTVVPGTRDWEALTDDSGKCAVELTEDEQIQIWGRRMFRQGRWQGKTFQQLADDPSLSAEEREDIKSILNKNSSSASSKKRSPVAYS